MHIEQVEAERPLFTQSEVASEVLVLAGIFGSSSVIGGAAFQPAHRCVPAVRTLFVASRPWWLVAGE